MIDKRDTLLELCIEVENFQHCSPNDDPEVLDAVFHSYKYLVKRFIKSPCRPES